MMWLMAAAALAWKETKAPDGDFCAPWCQYDNGEHGHPDACTAAFKSVQCHGCERCKRLREAEENATAIRRCELCTSECGGDLPPALMIELANMKEALERTRSELEELQAASTKAETSGKSAKERLAKAQKSADLRGAALVSLRRNQPDAYATLMLNTAPNATLRAVAGSAYTSQIVARRPWPNVSAIKGSAGGVHGVGTDRAQAVERWALSYAVGGEGDG